MPLNEYRCGDCGRAFERGHGWDEQASACPYRQCARVARLLPTFAAQVRGEGRGRPAGDDPACSPDGCERPGCPSARLN
jgi:putative FmdB family regulatory protein